MDLVFVEARLHQVQVRMRSDNDESIGGDIKSGYLTPDYVRVVPRTGALVMSLKDSC